MPPRLRAIAPWVVMFATVVLLGTLLLMLVDTGKISVGEAHAGEKPTPTATPTPTALPSPTATPLPTPRAGYLLFSDFPDGFYIQYPELWKPDYNQSASLVHFKDDAGNFDVSVGIGSSWSAPDPSKNTDEAAAWVDDVLSRFADQYGAAFSRATSPLPPETIGGIAWKTGTGRIDTGQVKYRIQVYATIHSGKPFIIGLVTTDGQFDQARGQYFLPMLHTFTFLTPGQ